MSPHEPRAASRSRFGVSAISFAVRPPSESCARSASPSRRTTKIGYTAREATGAPRFSRAGQAFCRRRETAVDFYSSSAIIAIMRCECISEPRAIPRRGRPGRHRAQRGALALRAAVCHAGARLRALAQRHAPHGSDPALAHGPGVRRPRRPAPDRRTRVVVDQGVPGDGHRDRPRPDAALAGRLSLGRRVGEAGTPRTPRVRLRGDRRLLHPADDLLDRTAARRRLRARELQGLLPVDLAAAGSSWRLARSQSPPRSFIATGGRS